MAVIHHTTLKPTKLELLTTWLPNRPWYRGGQGAPVLVKSGGFRLDDPEGEVGIECMVTTDTSAPEPTSYLVPLTYRGAPLDGMEHALVGTMEHGVLGKRWAYDGCHDPVLVTQLLQLIGGTVEAMAQSVSDTPDREVTRSHTGEPFTAPVPAPDPTDDEHGTRLAAPHGTTLHLHRVLTPASGDPSPGPNTVGQVTAGWSAPDGTRPRAVFAHLTAAAG
ncbi:MULTISPECIES: maltokinase N-terminal cap-like domain-containing protein [Streptomyces]|uniref:maltokinase N-terminal cap-like domain-containing protein n=1 Tax=Streptomyces TaxID=1883 RepID=UPI0029B4440D|nr:1,4-alpha-glucan branching protein [Streptomyces sp. WI03-4A]MDX2592629.1 1,4-alpha-glucan branching protein [Streptomyces sp. WI03-4A]